MPSSRIALLQNSGRPGDVEKNLGVLAGAAREAADGGAGLLVCPEMFLTGYAIGGDVPRLAETADGRAAESVARIAETHGIAILYGYPERAGSGEGSGARSGSGGGSGSDSGSGGGPAGGCGNGPGRDPGGVIHNAAQLIGPDGAPLANYRKTHLFGPYEQEWFTPGDTPVVQADLGGLRIGVMICYDVEFPENVRAHALAGTDLLLVPTALMHPFQFVAESVVPVRAFENQMYVAYVNRTGPEGDFEFAGLSSLAAPDGTTRARAGRGQELIFGDVDPELLRASRADNPYLRDRRPGLYTSLI